MYIRSSQIAAASLLAAGILGACGDSDGSNVVADQGAAGTQEEAGEVAEDVADGSDADGGDMSGPHGIDAELDVDVPEGWEFHFEEDHTIDDAAQAPEGMSADEAEALVGQPARVRIYWGDEFVLPDQFGGEVVVHQQISVGSNYLGDGATPCDISGPAHEDWDERDPVDVDGRRLQVVRSPVDDPAGEQPQYRICEDADDWEIMAYGNRHVSLDELVVFYAQVSLS